MLFSTQKMVIMFISLAIIITSFDLFCSYFLMAFVAAKIFMGFVWSGCDEFHSVVVGTIFIYTYRNFFYLNVSCITWMIFFFSFFKLIIFLLSLKFIIFIGIRIKEGKLQRQNMMLIHINRIFNLKVGEWNSNLTHLFLCIEDLLEVNNFIIAIIISINLSCLVFCLL